jgi:hypothetical protein
MALGWQSRIVRGSLVAALALVALIAGGARAEASFHQVDMREVYTGSVTNPAADYIELQMWAGGQTLVHLGQLSVYNANGTLNHAVSPASDVSSGANNATILIGGSAFATEFPGKAADFTDAALDMSAAGGAACWPTNSAPIDCVSWGSFTGTLPSPAGTPASATGITAGKAIQRSITPGCPTLLESADDTNNSATDFSEVDPAPRVNADAITEVSCAGSAPPPAVTATPLAAPRKKCKKTQKLKRGKCVKKKRKKK